MKTTTFNVATFLLLASGAWWTPARGMPEVKVDWQKVPDRCCASNTQLFEITFDCASNSLNSCAYNETWNECKGKCHFSNGRLCSFIEILQLGPTAARCRAYGDDCDLSEPCGNAVTWHRFGKIMPPKSCITEPRWRNQQWWNFSGALNRCGFNYVCPQEGATVCKSECTADANCDGFPMRVCSGHGRDAKCKHKNIFGHAAGYDLLAACVFFIISGLALSAGIGGGGLYVPLLMLLLGFSAHEATGLSQALLAGGASSTLVYNMRQRHPSGFKPMIDYDLVSVMGPNLLIGALLGTSLNIAAPSWLILVLLVVILGHSAWKTLQKGLKTLRLEKTARELPAGDGRLSKNVIERLLASLRKRCGFHARFSEPEPQGVIPDPEQSAASTLGHPPQFSDVPLDEEVPSPVKLKEVRSGKKCENATLPAVQLEVIPKPQPQFPLGHLAQFAAMMFIVVGCILARGGPTSTGFVSYCGQAYWILTALAIGALILLGLLGAKRALVAGDESMTQDAFRWSATAVQKVALCSLGAGTLASMCGIGGGMVMGPILLDLGVLPQVQSATTASTLFVVSSSAALAFLVQGAAPLDYAFFLAVATAMGAVIGKALVGFLVKLYRRPSAIIFLLAFIIVISASVMAVTGTIDVINDIRQGHDLGVQNMCMADSTERN